VGGQPGFRRAGHTEQQQGARHKSSGRCGSSPRPLAVRRSATLHEGEQAAADVVPDPACQHQRAHPYAYLKDVLERLPTQPASRVEELLPHRWKPLPPHPDTDHQRAGVLA